jgi:hypothetical protein
MIETGNKLELMYASEDRKPDIVTALWSANMHAGQGDLHDEAEFLIRHLGRL